MSKAFVVGLTGPMGSGKTMVAKLFAEHSYKVIDADILARKVVEKGSATLDKLKNTFGDSIISADGTLDRKKLSAIAFSSKENTKALNNITHPAIMELVKNSIQNFVSNGHTKILYDAPLLFESESDKLCDKVITVIADVDIRIERVKKRDNMSEQDIKKRIDSQHCDSYYIDKSDYVIYNNFSLDKLLLDTKKVISAIDEVYNVTF